MGRRSDSAGTEAALRARQGNRGAPELALGPDHNGLLVAVRRQRNVGRETGSGGDDLEIAVAGTSGKVAVDAAAAFAPVPGERSPLGDDIGLEIEFVAVAGTDEGLIEARPIAADGIGGAAPDSLGRPVVEGDGASARPVARKTREWRGLRITRRARHAGREHGREREYQASCVHQAVGHSACITAAMLPSDRCTVFPQMPHSISPIRRYH